MGAYMQNNVCATREPEPGQDGKGQDYSSRGPLPLAILETMEEGVYWRFPIAHEVRDVSLCHHRSNDGCPLWWLVSAGPTAPFGEVTERLLDVALREFAVNTAKAAPPANQATRSPIPR